MLALEEILCELERNEMECGLPPGFRFHPTDEELITFYLASKVFDGNFCPTIPIAEVDLNRCEPWELPDSAKMGEREWYFFSLRDRKYPTGLRTNRATGAGYWKATGKDREVYSVSSGALIGMKKTLVFYRGRAPRGEKTKWVMHEYRLDGDFSCRHACKEEWVICRIFHKIGDKKSPQMLQSSFPGNSLPPLLEPQSHQNQEIPNQNHQDQDPFLINNNNQEPDMKSLINPFLPQYDIFSSNFPNPSSLFTNKPLISHQDFTLKELSNVIAKQCKKEGSTAFSTSQSQLLYDGIVNMNWAEKIQENNNKYQNSMLFGLENRMGINFPIDTTGINHSGVTSAMDTTAAIDHVMLTEPGLRWW